MKYFLPLLFFSMAAVAIYIGSTADRFYPGRLGKEATGKPLPKWFGRMWFFGFAAIAIYMGIRNFP